MKKKPDVVVLEDGGIGWELSFDTFDMKMYIPKSELPYKIINYGFRAPFLLVFQEGLKNVEAVEAFAKEQGFAAIAASYACGVAVVSPKEGVGWDEAPTSI